MGEKLRPPKRFRMPYDMVNHPDHYKDENGRECIDIMLEKFGLDKVMAFCQLNAFKYLFRAGKKPGADKYQDEEKAKWYIAKYVSLGGSIKDFE